MTRQVEVTGWREDGNVVMRPESRYAVTESYTTWLLIFLLAEWTMPKMDLKRSKSASKNVMYERNEIEEKKNNDRRTGGGTGCKRCKFERSNRRECDRPRFVFNHR